MAYIDDQMQHRLALAYWWMHAASNGHAAMRKITMGSKLMTADELRDDAMNTSLRHLDLYMECAEHKHKMKKENNDRMVPTGMF